MARACKIVGGALAALGVAVALTFVISIARDAKYREAALAAARNPGNVMYETEFGVARVKRAFELVGVVAGMLLSINGATVLGLGVVVGHLDRK